MCETSGRCPGSDRGGWSLTSVRRIGPPPGKPFSFVGLRCVGRHGEGLVAGAMVGHALGRDAEASAIGEWRFEERPAWIVVGKVHT